MRLQEVAISIDRTNCLLSQWSIPCPIGRNTHDEGVQGHPGPTNRTMDVLTRRIPHASRRTHIPMRTRSSTRPKTTNTHDGKLEDMRSSKKQCIECSDTCCISSLKHRANAPMVPVFSKQAQPTPDHNRDKPQPHPTPSFFSLVSSSPPRVASSTPRSPSPGPRPAPHSAPRRSGSHDMCVQSASSCSRALPGR